METEKIHLGSSTQWWLHKSQVDGQTNRRVAAREIYPPSFAVSFGAMMTPLQGTSVCAMEVDDSQLTLAQLVTSTG